MEKFRWQKRDVTLNLMRLPGYIFSKKHDEIYLKPLKIFARIFIKIKDGNRNYLYDYNFDLISGYGSSHPYQSWARAF